MIPRAAGSARLRGTRCPSTPRIPLATRGAPLPATDGPSDGAIGLARLQVLALVGLALAAADAELDLHERAEEVEGERDDRRARALEQALELVQLAPVEEALAAAARLVVEVRRLRQRRDVNPVKPEFSV